MCTLSCTPTQFLHIRFTRNHFCLRRLFCSELFNCESSKKTCATWLQATDHRVCGGSELCTLFGVSRRETVNQPCPHLLTISSSQLHTIPLAVILPRLKPTLLPRCSTRPTIFTAGTRRHPRVRTHVRGNDGHLWRPHENLGGGRQPAPGQSRGH